MCVLSSNCAMQFLLIIIKLMYYYSTKTSKRKELVFVMASTGDHNSSSFTRSFGRGRPQVQARIEEFNYYDVQLLKEELCGTGSYGIVCKAIVDQLVCAAKIIHPTFFSEMDPSSTKTFHQFEKECDFLSAIRHPCIVQYLGTTKDIETGLPVLLMELMDESMTKFLKRTLDQGELVPFHTQVNFCHDISMALAFLHSNGIVHRDLSSNNILLFAGSKAKVTDFGMSKLIERNPRMTPLTQCPGTLVYMPPETLRIPPTYTEKLDVFSFGVCIIQLLTCHFPKPADAKRTVYDSRHGTIEVPIPEQERRRDDIKSIPKDNLLLATALDCLSDNEMSRPSSKDLCHRMIYYKVCPDYSDSVAQAKERASLLKTLEKELMSKNHEISVLRETVNAKEVEIDSMQETCQRKIEAVMKEKDFEIQRLKNELDNIQKDNLTASSNSHCPNSPSFLSSKLIKNCPNFSK